jgi:hypothetical protein
VTPLSNPRRRAAAAKLLRKNESILLPEFRVRQQPLVHSFVLLIGPTVILLTYAHTRTWFTSERTPARSPLDISRRGVTKTLLGTFDVIVVDSES